MILEPQIGSVSGNVSQDERLSGRFVPSLHADEPVWYALRPEIRSGALSFADLGHLVEQQQLRFDDFIWHPVWQVWKPAREVPGLFPSVNGAPELHAASRVAEGNRNSNAKPNSKKNLKTRAKQELRSYAIITVYVWTVLSLLRLHASLLAGTHSVDLQEHGWTIVSALVLGKVVLIAEALHVGERVSARAPAFVILLKSLLFAGSILLFQLAEHVATALWNGEELMLHAPHFNVADIQRSLTMCAIIMLALMPYFLVKEIERRTGQTDLLLLAIGMKR